MQSKRDRAKYKAEKGYDYLLMWIIVKNPKVNCNEPFLEETKEVKVNAIRLQLIEEYVFHFTTPRLFNVNQVKSN